EFLVQLALVYEEQGELERCEKLLTPHTGRLKATEGARILGHILADQGKTEEAYPLLRRYVDENLKHLREAEKVCKETFRASGDAITKEVQTGSARDFPRQEFERASDVDKQAIYLRYLGQRLREDPALQAAEAALAKHRPVATVAQDLSILHRSRARGMKG